MDIIYISHSNKPQTRAEELVRVEEIKEVLERSGYRVITPQDIVPSHQPYNYTISRRIEQLLSCSAAIFIDEWKTSSLCKMERYACGLHGIDTYEEDTWRDLLANMV